jgi:uncharacterized protein YbjT (DUF2867 family)
MTDHKKTVVLVVGATGRIGSEVCKALTMSKNSQYVVFGTTRHAPSAKLAKMGVTSVKFAFGEAASMEAALEASQATVVFFVTDFFGAAKGKADVEAQHGKIIIDACQASGVVQHVVFSSVADCDACPRNVEYFKTKVYVEDYRKDAGLPNFSILRPVAFLENLNDPSNYNPLTKGRVQALWPADLRLQMVSCVDIGKAALAMIASPAEWKGKTLDCASCNVTGMELAQALSQASGVRCTYRVAVPPFVQKLCMKDLYHMVRFFQDQGYTANLAEFKKVVPDAMGPLEFFQHTGTWSNGEAFLSCADGVLAEAKGQMPYLVYASAAVGLMAVYAAAAASRVKRGRGFGVYC